MNVPLPEACGRYSRWAKPGVPTSFLKEVSLCYLFVIKLTFVATVGDMLVLLELNRSNGGTMPLSLPSRLNGQLRDGGTSDQA